MQFIILNELTTDSTNAIIDSILGTAGLSLICLFISNNMKYYLPRRERYWYILIVSTAGGAIWILLQKGIFSLILPDYDPYLQMIRDTWQIRFVASYLMISSMSMFSLLWYSQEEQKEINNRKIEIE